jgi:hypothetical protein
MAACFFDLRTVFAGGRRRAGAPQSWPPRLKLDSNIASSAVRSAIRSSRMLSFTACAPSPTPPSPSSVGTPSAAVKLPSEPPPVADSSSFTPNSWRSRAPFLKQLANGRRSLHRRAIQSAVHVNGAAFVERAQRSELFVQRGGVLQSRMRMSTSARASAATTLVRVPPAITPGFTVMPCFRLVNRRFSGIWRANSTTALAPPS